MLHAWWDNISLLAGYIFWNMNYRYQQTCWLVSKCNHNVFCYMVRIVWEGKLKRRVATKMGPLHLDADISLFSLFNRAWASSRWFCIAFPRRELWDRLKRNSDHLVAIKGEWYAWTSVQDYIGEDGTLHIVADARTMPEAVFELDLYQARLLTQVAGFWQRRSRYQWQTTYTRVTRCEVKGWWCNVQTMSDRKL